MKETLVLVADPDIPRIVAGDGMELSGGHGAYGDKPAMLEIGNAARGGDPGPPAIILKKALRRIIGQSTVFLAVNRNLIAIPPVQTSRRANPNAATHVCLDRPEHGTGQTLLDRKHRDRKVAEAIKAIRRGYPNIAFPILKEIENGIAGETIELRKLIGPSPVQKQ